MPDKSKITIFLNLPPISAGFPSPVEDLIESSLDLNQHLIQNPAATYFVRAKGNSMIGAGIFDGDILIVDKSIDPQNESIVIASIDGEFTVKRYINRPNEIILEPENINYPEIKINPSDDFQIWGVVTNTIHSLN